MPEIDCFCNGTQRAPSPAAGARPASRAATAPAARRRVHGEVRRAVTIRFNEDIERVFRPHGSTVFISRVAFGVLPTFTGSSPDRSRCSSAHIPRPAPLTKD
jgi:hypothetical protein